MKYWHIQMHPANQKKFDRTRITRILTETGLIGVGEWEEGASIIRQFSDEVKEGDIFLVRSGGPLALVEIAGELEYEEDPNEELDWFQNRRSVKILGWHTQDLQTKLPRRVDGIYNTKSFARVYDSQYIKRWHKMILRDAKQTEVAALLEAKGQIILQGPPGTGKTWLAERVAEKLAAKEDVTLVQFHPAYAYEDFVRGIVVETNSEGHLIYEAKNKVLADIARQASAAPNRPFVLIIDEINRANLPSVLGELIYALEYRGKEVESIYGLSDKKDRKLILPKNLLIIGTMNTADRSVGHLDYAIRRRFAFVSVLPDAAVIEEAAGQQLFEQVARLFTEEHLAPEFEPEQVQPGHSYFMSKAGEGLTLTQKLEYEIRPLLHEYLRDGVLKPSAKDAVDKLRA